METKLSDPGLAFLEDARYRRLEVIIKELERRMKTEYTHRLKPEDERIIKQAKRDLLSIGRQLETTYLDQLSLLPDGEPRKVIQKR